MPVFDIRFEAKESLGDKEGFERVKKALEKEFGELWECKLINVD